MVINTSVWFVSSWFVSAQGAARSSYSYTIGVFTHLVFFYRCFGSIRFFPGFFLWLDPLTGLSAAVYVGCSLTVHTYAGDARIDS